MRCRVTAEIMYWSTSRHFSGHFQPVPAAFYIFWLPGFLKKHFKRILLKHSLHLSYGERHSSLRKCTMEKSGIWHIGVPGIISFWTSARLVDYRRASKTEHTPPCKGSRRVDSIKFLGVHISFDHSGTLKISQLAKKAQQWFFLLRKLKHTSWSYPLSWSPSFTEPGPKSSCVSVSTRCFYRFHQDKRYRIIQTSNPLPICT